jgi:hypothetical protein
MNKNEGDLIKKEKESEEKDLKEGVPLSNFLQILSKKNRGKTAAEIAAEKESKSESEKEKEKEEKLEK